jgi:hypothetical protein
VSGWIQDLVRLAATRAAHEHALGAALLRALRAEVWRALGMASFYEYAERVVGLTPRQTEERVRVATALEARPRTSAALADGRVHFTAVRELTRVSTVATEDDWLAAAEGKTVGEIACLVAGRRAPPSATRPTKVAAVTRSTSPDAPRVARRPRTRAARPSSSIPRPPRSPTATRSASTTRAGPRRTSRPRRVVGSCADTTAGAPLRGAATPCSPMSTTSACVRTAARAIPTTSSSCAPPITTPSNRGAIHIDGTFSSGLRFTTPTAEYGTPSRPRAAAVLADTHQALTGMGFKHREATWMVNALGPHMGALDDAIRRALAPWRSGTVAPPMHQPFANPLA